MSYILRRKPWQTFPRQLVTSTTALLATLFILLTLPRYALSESHSIIPEPKRIEIINPSLTLSLPVRLDIDVPTSVQVTTNDFNTLFQQQNNAGKSAGTRLRVKILIDHQKTKTYGKEGYELNITGKPDNTITITSAEPAGAFYGVQTLKQILPVSISGTVIIPGYRIKDAPRYRWRGIMLDVARNFLRVEYLKKQIDRMAFYKLNRLHLHLTDDQGWRITIPAYPKLATHGGSGHVNIGEGGQRGYFTEAELMEITRYAKDHFVDIVPEIDMPGHTYAALASVPEINCKSLSNIQEPKGSGMFEAPPRPPALYSGIGVAFSSLCLPNRQISRTFAETIWHSAILQTTPTFIHMGGDELSFYQGLYKEYVVFLGNLALGKKRTPVFWEEAGNASLPKGSVIQAWKKDSRALDIAAKKKYGVIRSDCEHLYFDHGNDTSEPNTTNWCSPAVTLKDAYNFDPGNAEQLEGIEATLFGEHIVSEKIADQRLFPRSLAAAEISWSSNRSGQFEDFKARLGVHGTRLNAMGISFYCTPTVPWNKCPTGGSKATK